MFIYIQATVKMQEKKDRIERMNRKSIFLNIFF
jgi:hypothetical protein